MKSFAKLLSEFISILIVSVGIVLVVGYFVAQPLEISGDSMYPTFKNGEAILAEKFSIKTEDIHRGDIVIFKREDQNDRLVIKRVIGLPNETFEIKEGKVYINDSEMVEHYLPSNANTREMQLIKEGIKYQIPAYSYVVLGDNRDMSSDSREWGFLKKENIIGKAFIVYYPPKNFRFIKSGK